MITTARRRIPFFLSLVLSGLFFSTGAGYAQGQSSVYATVQDTLHILRIMGGDTIPSSLFSASYHYEMVYDSLSHTNYMFTECRKNSTPVKLMHWQDNRMVHGSAEYLTFNSRTVDFPIQAGDTISFYRELRWYNPITRRQDTNNYYGLDTLDFVVHLVRTSDGEPIAQLDSIGILPRTPVGSPRIYGARPLMAVAQYVVPLMMMGDSAFIGVTVSARGSGPNHFTRLDNVTIGVSRRLNDPYYQQYLAIYGTVYGKRNIEELTQERGDGDAMLAVASEPGTPGRIAVKFSGSPDGGFTAVGIYDASGRLVFYPYSGRGSERELHATYNLPNAGLYFVVLLHEGRIVRTAKITITK